MVTLQLSADAFESTPERISKKQSGYRNRYNNNANRSILCGVGRFMYVPMYVYDIIIGVYVCSMYVCVRCMRMICLHVSACTTYIQTKNHTRLSNDDILSCYDVSPFPVTSLRSKNPHNDSSPLISFCCRSTLNSTDWQYCLVIASISWNPLRLPLRNQ